jgi:hypothetical protein
MKTVMLFLRGLVVSVIFLSITYLLVAFITSEHNPLLWCKCLRFFTGSFSGLILFVIFREVFFGKDDVYQSFNDDYRY